MSPVGTTHTTSTASGAGGLDLLSGRKRAHFGFSLVFIGDIARYADWRAVRSRANPETSPPERTLLRPPHRLPGVTFSICVRERYTDDDGGDQVRYGVAVTTRLPGVGTLCPFASADGAVATQSLVNVELGRKGIGYLGAGLAVDDALEALLNADEGKPQRQLHGVDADGTFAFSGEECNDWYGHVVGEN